MISQDDIDAMKDYEHHYPKHVECDMCGQMTRGRVYRKAPDLVLCGACNKPIIGNITKEIVVNLPFLSTQLNFSLKSE